MCAMSPRLLRPIASGGFNPKSIAGLSLWLDSSKASSLTFNGGTVSQWDDLSGKGFHATQSTGNDQPTYQATGLNSRPTLFFDTTDSVLSTATTADLVLTPTTSPSMAFFLVCYMPAFISSGAIAFSSETISSNRIWFYSHFDLGAGNRAVFFDTVNANTGRTSAQNQTDTGWGTPHILTAYRFGATMSVRRNGVQIAGRTDASGNYTATNLKLQLGKAVDGGGSQMYLSEFLAYAQSLSTDQVDTIERSLARKWGVTL
jgi:hypothetical protein